MPKIGRTQKELAWLAGYKYQGAIYNLLTRKGWGALPRHAKALASLTGSDPFLWLKGGSLAERRQKVNGWIEADS